MEDYHDLDETVNSKLHDLNSLITSKFGNNPPVEQPKSLSKTTLVDYIVQLYEQLQSYNGQEDNVYSKICDLTSLYIERMTKQQAAMI